MTDRSLSFLLLFGAVATATLLLLGIASTVVVGQTILIAAGTLVLAWTELKSEDGRFIRFLRLVAVCYWCLAVTVLVTALVFESVQYYVTPGPWRPFLLLSLFAIGTAASYGFACFAVLNRRVKWPWTRLLVLVVSGYFSYWWNRDVNAVEALIVPVVMLCLVVLFKAGESVAGRLEPVVQQIPAIAAKLQQMGPGLMVFYIGYACIIVFFTGVYACIEAWRPDSFGGDGFGLSTQDSSVVDKGISRFLHLSVATGTTLGYGDIYPTQPFARLLTSCQVILSLGWTVVVFVAAVETVKDSTSDTP